LKNDFSAIFPYSPVGLCTVLLLDYVMLVLCMLHCQPLIILWDCLWDTNDVFPTETYSHGGFRLLCINHFRSK